MLCEIGIVSVVSAQSSNPYSSKRLLHKHHLRPARSTRAWGTVVLGQSGDAMAQTWRCSSTSSLGFRRRGNLPNGFTPSKHDVICGKGKTYRDWPGNVRFRKLIEGRVQEYLHSEGRHEKGIIIREIVEEVRRNSPGGGFVKQDPNGSWYEVGCFLAREKTSQHFRDCLDFRYSSSRGAKKRRRLMGTKQQDQLVSPSCQGPRDACDRVVDGSELQQRVARDTDEESGSSDRYMTGLTTSNKRGALATEATPMHVQFQNAIRHTVQGTTVTQTDEHPCPDSPQMRTSVVDHHYCGLGVQLSTSRGDSACPAEAALLAGSGFLSQAAIRARVADLLSVQRVQSSGFNDALRGSSLPFALDRQASFQVPEVAVCAVQTAMRSENESPLHAAHRIVSMLKTIRLQQRVDLFVLPELSPVGYNDDTLNKYLPRSQLLKNMYCLIDDVFAQCASLMSCYVCYGTIGWKTDSEGRDSLTIQQKVLDRCGKVVAVYDKVNLSSIGESAETKFFARGTNNPVSFSVDGCFRFGLLISEDIRNPLIARALTRHHEVDALLQPTSYRRDISFGMWKSFRETRAVENSVYFIGVNYAGNRHGDSSIVPPWVDDDHEPLGLGTEEGFVVGRVKRSDLDLARTALPTYRAIFHGAL